MILWWAHVIETPDLIKIRVFNKGTFTGLNGLVFSGGHICPISKFGLMLEWKNDQKNLVKNNTSDVINSNIPIFNPFVTMFWWNPSFLDSLMVFFHHKVEEMHNIARLMLLIFVNLEFNLDVICNMKFMVWIELMIGQGLKEIMWNWWNLFII